MGKGEHSHEKDEVALVMFDRAHKWLYAYPDLTNDTSGVVRAFQHFSEKM